MTHIVFDICCSLARIISVLIIPEDKYTYFYVAKLLRSCYYQSPTYTVCYLSRKRAQH